MGNNRHPLDAATASAEGEMIMAYGAEIPDALDMFHAEDHRKEQWRESRPKCIRCLDHIQQETAVFLHGQWYCDECLEENRVEVDI